MSTSNNRANEIKIAFFKGKENPRCWRVSQNGVDVFLSQVQINVSGCGRFDQTDSGVFPVFVTQGALSHDGERGTIDPMKAEDHPPTNVKICGPRRRNGWRTWHEEHDVKILPEQNGETLFLLDGLPALLWKAIDGISSIDELLATVSRQLMVSPAKIQTPFHETLRQFSAHGWIDFHDENSSSENPTNRKLMSIGLGNPKQPLRPWWINNFEGEMIYASEIRTLTPIQASVVYSEEFKGYAGILQCDAKIAELGAIAVIAKDF